MELISTVTVDAPVDRTWAAVTDLRQVVSYLPDARRVPQHGPHDHDQTTVAWHSPLCRDDVTARIVERDDDAHRMVLRVEGGVSATVRVALQPQGTGTRIGVETGLTPGGATARTGRGVIAGAVAKLVGQAAQRLEAALRAAAPPAAGEAAAPREPAVSAPDPIPARDGAGLPRAVPVIAALLAVLLGWRFARRAGGATRRPA
ncbi:SRPBCC family protein [Pseudonocardia acidicola]|uniref:Carbon monoxide dehydrogenase subunit G n=1 Tax=Pseudonocardia acidicola TaxID=2724939 RepID=A0ABX1SE64_9PSEU|nr:hypothetical protein [Pseudonocardia acidicola]